MTLGGFLLFLMGYLFFAVLAWHMHRTLFISMNASKGNPSAFTSKAFLLLVLTLIFALLIGRMIWRQHHITIAELRANDWVIDSCSVEELTPCNPGLDQWGPPCDLNDDGYIYHAGRPVGQVIKAHRSFFADPGALRNGGMMTVQSVTSGETCTYDTPMGSWEWRGFF